IRTTPGLRAAYEAKYGPDARKALARARQPRIDAVPELLALLRDFEPADAAIGALEDLVVELPRRGRDAEGLGVLRLLGQRRGGEQWRVLVAEAPWPRDR